MRLSFQNNGVIRAADDSWWRDSFEMEVVPRSAAEELVAALDNVYDIGPAQSRIIDAVISRYRGIAGSTEIVRPGLEAVTKESHDPS